MTFPLMSGGLLRRHPERPGEALAMLYFTNSFGAAVGVLASGFVLIERLGLARHDPGCRAHEPRARRVVWLLAPGRDPDPARVAAADDRATRRSRGRAEAPWRLLLAVAVLTGMASFIYEIGWIRMLTLVLGAATHSFELMLSAFILGLAFGGLWVRGRIDRARQPLAFLGIVQIAMGLAALATLPLYGAMFDLMQLVIQGTAKTDAGYGIFLVASHGIALAIMFPAAFCAGMTLPLITYALLAAGHGERSIGAVYAANTRGSIAGVVARGTHRTAAARTRRASSPPAPRSTSRSVWCCCGGSPSAASRAPDVAPSHAAGRASRSSDGRRDWHSSWSDSRSASTLTRWLRACFAAATFTPRTDAELKFYRDGKTTSVSLMQFREGLSLRTNGKSDGAINLERGRAHLRRGHDGAHRGAAARVSSPTRSARRSSASAPASRPTPCSASPALERVDTIEIEPAMAEASRAFAARNASAFADPRSRIVFDDAKT